MNLIRAYSGLLSWMAFLWGTTLLTACSKLKENQQTGNLPLTSQVTSSTVRIVNMAGFTDLAVDSQKLTNFVLPDPAGDRYPKPTPYFPATGELGTTYLLPEQFFNGYDSAFVQLSIPEGTGNGNYGEYTVPFGVKETYQTPNDYYWVYSRLASAPTQSYSFYDSMVVVPRGVSPAADPTHFLVRLVNLSSAPDDAGGIGPMSLVYADGSHVNAATDVVTPHSWSSYVELPYGTYQFKVLTAQNMQVTGVPVNLLIGPTVNNQFTTVLQGLGTTYAPVQTFQPGGVYTIEVSPNADFQYPYGSGTVANEYNAFSIITDVAPPVNLTYSRIQAVNAVPGDALTVLVDGAALSSGLAYDSAGAYQVYIAGTHTVSIQDAGGNQLAGKSFNLPPNTNFSVWTYPSGSGVDFMLVQNNLSGSDNLTYNVDGSDAGPNTLATSTPYWIRFLNLCPDLPYVTFTEGSGTLFSDGAFSTALAAQNLPFGAQLSSASVPFPYVSIGGNNGLGAGFPGQVQVYQSGPSSIPGNWLSDIPSLVNTQFITMPASFYPAGLPSGEPGVYTVALTGRYGPGAPAGQEAKMIIIKHTK